MTRKVSFFMLLAFFWGWCWAGILQFTRFGRFLALKRTWLTVVIGIGVDLLLAAAITSRRCWLMIAGLIGLSSIGIITRSLANELGEINEVIGAHQDAPGQ